MHISQGRLDVGNSFAPTQSIETRASYSRRFCDRLSSPEELSVLTGLGNPWGGYLEMSEVNFDSSGGGTDGAQIENSSCWNGFGDGIRPARLRLRGGTGYQDKLHAGYRLLKIQDLQVGQHQQHRTNRPNCDSADQRCN